MIGTNELRAASDEVARLAFLLAQHDDGANRTSGKHRAKLHEEMVRTRRQWVAAVERRDELRARLQGAR